MKNSNSYISVTIDRHEGTKNLTVTEGKTEEISEEIEVFPVGSR